MRQPRHSIVLRTDAELSAAREQLDHDLERPPDKMLAFWSEMPLLYGDDGTKTESETAYHDCPMHPEIAASFAGTCPKCGMKLVPASPEVPTPMPYTCPMHDEIVAAWAASCPLCGMTLLRSDGVAEAEDGESVPHSHGPGDSIEWEDDMVEINRQTNTGNMIWQLIDRDTGAKNGDISWKFTVGDRVKIRLVNEMGSDHPMPHPFHVHGAGRFLVLSKRRRDRDEPRLEGHGAAARRARPSTSCSTSPTPASGWRTATSPSTTRAA